MQKAPRQIPPEYTASATCTRSALSPEEVVIRYAQSITGRHYQPHQELRLLNFTITERLSDLDLSATLDLVETDGLTFHVSIDYQAHGWRVTHIIRQRPA
jgi:hypothetical protein